ncbi:MAG TPA: hypothetical protein VJ949_08710, partial [Cryomorphaceae bacterium]|nr:hypothetical protein [Cryomorphaceae bacterium]
MHYRRKGMPDGVPQNRIWSCIAAYIHTYTGAHDSFVCLSIHAYTFITPKIQGDTLSGRKIN